MMMMMMMMKVLLFPQCTSFILSLFLSLWLQTSSTSIYKHGKHLKAAYKYARMPLAPVLSPFICMPFTSH
ncbi:hypothetical protein XELAEV_18017152mg [Xenopus laevis]|uniref:Secreted protein n=1 Tax=Xenopus laevis TaxID=8355 RepID=A0A974DAP3_XENLA|nr:hypothetical protein XELAEV_18017152mg [Xenopus laevis]